MKKLLRCTVPGNRDSALKSTITIPWATLWMWASIAFGIPLAVLILGTSLVWAFSGFAPKRA